MSRRGCRFWQRFTGLIPSCTLLALLAAAPSVCSAQLIVGVDVAQEGIWNMDPSNNSVQTFLPGFAGTNLATDEVNKVLYFMSNTVQLWKWDYSTTGNTPVFIASLTSATSSPFISMNGLAYSSATGKLYGSRSLQSGSDPEGFYEIDPTTGFCTNKIATTAATYDWGGFDRDATTGKFYAAGDPGVSGTSTPGIFEVNFTTNTFAQIAPYPAGATDMDGVAVGDGKIYMIEDRAVQVGGKIHVYNIASGLYESPLMVPWFFNETFSGGTWSPSLAAALANVPEPTSAGMLALGASALIARRRRNRARRMSKLAAATLAVTGACAATSSQSQAQIVMATGELNQGIYVGNLATMRQSNQFPLPANIIDWDHHFVGRNIRGMAADEPTRTLYWLDLTVEGTQVASTLWKMSYDTLAPVKVGVVRNSSTGFELGFAGLALDPVNQKMYGTYNIGGTPGEGIYEIDYLNASGNSVFAQPRLLYNTLPGGESAYDFSSLDFDPVTGKMYGVNNDGDQQGRGIYSFDLVGGSLTKIVASPDYRRIENDIDGLATGGGKAFLTTDEPGFVYQYDLVTNNGQWVDFLSPILTDSGLFGGAAYAPGMVVPEPGSLSLLAGAGALLGLRRRSRRTRATRQTKSIESFHSIHSGRMQMKSILNKRSLQALTVLATASLAGVSYGQLSFVVVIKDTEPVAGVGNVTSIEQVKVNNNGDTLVEVDTDGATTADAALIRNGSVVLQEGFVPAGLGAGTLSSFDTINLTNGGVTGYNVFFSGTGSTSNDSGVMRGQDITVREGTFSTSPVFSANTPYIGWFETRWNDNNQVAVLASVDDPAITSTVDRAIVRWNLTPGGALSSEDVVLKEGDAIAGMGGALYTDAGSTGPHSFNFNNAGQIIHTVDTDAVTTADSGVLINTTVIAREGDASGAVAGRNWGSVASARVDINNSGGWVIAGTLDSTNTTTDSIIVANGAKVIQEGDAPPGVAGGPFALTAFGTGAVAIDDSNNVFWLGDWNDADTTRDVGLFMNNTLLVQEGVTLINGTLLQSISTIQDNFSISDNGQFLIFDGVLAGQGDAAIMIAIPEPASATALLLGVGAMAIRRRVRR